MPKAYRDMSPTERWARTSKGFRKIRTSWWAQGHRTCWLCGKPITEQNDYTLDHVVPLSQGGTNALENLKPAHGRRRPDCPGNYGRQNKQVKSSAKSREW